jgi:hypothetical protein
MQQYPDIAILDELGSPAVVVEVKAGIGTTPDWAASVRRNLAAHSLLPNARFFIVATPDKARVDPAKEFLVSGWLAELAFDPAAARLPADAVAWVQQSGLLEAVRRGRRQLH